MIEKLEPLQGLDHSWLNKINELVDAVNGILAAQEQYSTIYKEDIVPMLTPKNEEPAENVQDETPRCPFCGEELSYAQEIDGGFDILTCDCPAGLWLFGNDKMWYNLKKATTELERTRKALDAALDWLGQVATLEKCDDDLCREFTKRKLAEIKTTLEQKE